MNNIFLKIYQFFEHKKLLFIGILIAIASGLVLIDLNLKLEEDISKLIPKSEESETLNKVLKNVDFSDKIIVNIYSDSLGDSDQLTDYATEFIDSLNQQCSEYIAHIQGEVSDDDMTETFDFVYENLPLFLDKSDYEQLAEKITSDSIAQYVKSNFHTLISPTGLFAKKIIRKDPFGLSFLALTKLEELKISSDFDIYNGFLVSKDKKNLLLFIKPALSSNETDKNTQFVEQLYSISNDLNTKYLNKKSIKSEYYGSTIIAVANASQIKHDIHFTVSIALAVLFFILILFYRKLLVPIILFIPTLFAALTAIAFLYFLRHEISAISIGIGSVLLGITLDFSLHILTHYRSVQDPKKLYEVVVQPILMSSFTTAVAFLCLVFLKSQALQDLGIFAAISVLSSAIYALIIIPLLFKPYKTPQQKKNNIIEKFAHYEYHKSKPIIIGVLLLLIGSFFTYSKVTFDKDMSKMNYQEKETLLAEKHLEELLSLSSKSLYIVSYGDNEEDILKANSAVNTILQEEKKKKNILSYSSIGSLVLSEENQERKINDWNLFWQRNNSQRIKEELIQNGQSVGFDSTTYTPFYNLLDKSFTTISLEKYSAVKSFFVSEYINTKTDFKTAVSLIKTEDTNGKNLDQLIADIPNTILIDRGRINETFLGSLHSNFSRLINYSFLAVFLILLFFYRKIGITLFTIFPIVITWIITLGIMGVLGIQFTIFNVIISTFIFGLGIDYSIFMTNALVEDYTYGTKEIGTYKVSIILSIITTILGLGVLIFAKHPSLISIASLCLIGIIVSPLVTFTLQPLLFNFIVNSRVKKGYSPLKLRSFFNSIFSLFIYISGGLLLSIFSMLVLPIIPFKKSYKLRRMHYLIARLQQVVMYSNPFTKKKIINNYKEKFEKPAIIIANHSSSLDVLIIGLVSKKIVFIVNDWVYTSKIFGKLAQALGFFPVSKGMEEGVKLLQAKVDQGYSLMIFPEGKRSTSNKMGRFHKGAFFLQEQLKVDILPLHFHGNAEVMPKDDFIIHDGVLTLNVGERIAYDDYSYGKTYKERTKKISRFFKSKFFELRLGLEGENYFRRNLFSNYLLKDRKIEKEVGNDFEKNKKSYLELNNTIPMKLKMLHMGNDYGQIDILLLSKSMDRNLTSYTLDTLKRTVAQNCFTPKTRNIKWIDTMESIEYSTFDTILISSPEYLKNNSIFEKQNLKKIILFNLEGKSTFSVLNNFSCETMGSGIQILTREN